jgi:fused signal recognition particle receptor
MQALWIVLAVVAVLVVIGIATLVLRRRRSPVPPTPPASTEPLPQSADVDGAQAAAPVQPAAPRGPPSYRSRLGVARGRLTGYLVAIRARGALDGSVWNELEEALLGADVGVETTGVLLAELQAKVDAGEIRSPEQLVTALGGALTALLSQNGDRELAFDPEPSVTNVWLFVGVNGVGKTTSVGKVARAQQEGGRSVLLAAGDTFRAAAGEQLAQWADRSDVEIVRGAEGGDPSAIVFDAVRRAAARGNDLVLADTAGRLHTKVNLVEELKKIRRVADRSPGRVSEVLLVLDATTGQNGLVQARQFTEAVGVTGIVLTKLDGTAKGGVVVAIERELGIPVKLVGLGEGPDDLVAFDPTLFVEALVGA